MTQILIRMDCWLNSAQSDWLKSYSREKEIKESQLMRLVIGMFLDGIESETIIVDKNEDMQDLVRGVIRITEAQYRSLGLLSREQGKTTQSLLRQATQYYINRLQGMETINLAPATPRKLMKIVAANPMVPGGSKLQGYKAPRKIRFEASRVFSKAYVKKEIENLKRREKLRDNQLDQFMGRVREIVGRDFQPPTQPSKAKIRGLDSGFIESLITSLFGSENEYVDDMRKELEKMLDKV